MCRLLHFSKIPFQGYCCDWNVSFPRTLLPPASKGTWLTSGGDTDKKSPARCWGAGLD